MCRGPRPRTPSSAPAGQRDFDGDGLAELAISAPGDGSGTVQTLELGAAGVGTGQPDPFTAGDVGVPKSTTGEDRFGTALTAGDVNADSRDDLAVGIPDWNCLECDEFFGSGGVVLVRGSAAGLSGDGAQFWTQDSPGVAGVARAEDAFGYAVAIGPLDDDGYADLAVGTPQDTDFSGSVTLLRGSATGLTTGGFGGRYIDQGTAGIAGAVETGDFFGGTLTTSFIQSANQANLVIAADGRDHRRQAGHRADPSARHRRRRTEGQRQPYLPPGQSWAEGDTGGQRPIRSFAELKNSPPVEPRPVRQGASGELPVAQNSSPAGSRRVIQPSPSHRRSAPSATRRWASASRSSQPRSMWARTSVPGSSGSSRCSRNWIDEPGSG